MLSIGITGVIISAFYESSFLAIFGTAFIFWGAILFYITPEKHVPLPFLEAAASGNLKNIERILSEFCVSEKGIYLPPKNLKNMESSLIFVPKTSQASLPIAQEINDKINAQQENGIFITPPGLGLSLLFEKELNIQFTKTSVADLRSIMPKILVDNLELAEDVEVNMLQNVVTVKIVGSILNNNCMETNNEPGVHAQVGCLLTSALACVLAKATGKPVTILKETVDYQAKIAIVDFNIIDG